MSYLSTREIPLAAGVAVTIGANGRKFCLLESTGRLDVVFIDVSGQTVGEASQILDGIGILMPRDFYKLRLSSATAQTVRIAMASEDVDFTRVSGTVTANVVQATSITNGAAVAVSNVAATAILAAGSRKKATFHNPAANTGAMNLGGALVTAANAAIVLQPGDTWSESEAAPAAWYAVAAVNGESLRVAEGV